LYWLDRFSKEGIDGLKDRSKSGRPPEILKEVAVRIRKELLESKQGWTTKQVSDMICTEGGVRKISPYSYLQNTSQVGFQTEGTKKSAHQYSFN
jgi:transposase